MGIRVFRSLVYGGASGSPSFNDAQEFSSGRPRHHMIVARTRSWRMGTAITRPADSSQLMSVLLMWGCRVMHATNVRRTLIIRVRRRLMKCNF